MYLHFTVISIKILHQNNTDMYSLQVQRKLTALSAVVERHGRGQRAKQDRSQDQP